MDMKIKKMLKEWTWRRNENTEKEKTEGEYDGWRTRGNRNVRLEVEEWGGRWKEEGRRRTEGEEEGGGRQVGRLTQRMDGGWKAGVKDGRKGGRGEVKGKE